MDKHALLYVLARESALRKLAISEGLARKVQHLRQVQKVAPGRGGASALDELRGAPSSLFGGAGQAPPELRSQMLSQMGARQPQPPGGVQGILQSLLGGG
jgi:hypothetical protein